MDAELREILDKFGEEIISEIIAGMEAGKVNATGKSADSLRKESPEDGLIVYGAESFVWIEQGRGPGKRPPFDAIKEWVEARGLEKETDESTKSFVFAIMNKIAQDGTSLHARSERRDVYSSIITEERLDALTTIITDTFTRKITSDIIQAFK